MKLKEQTNEFSLISNLRRKKNLIYSLFGISTNVQQNLAVLLKLIFFQVYFDVEFAPQPFSEYERLAILMSWKFYDTRISGFL